jgi:hypothetical protein
MMKQHLLSDSKASSVLDVVRDAVGLHATDPRTTYVALWSRMKGFGKEMLDRELHDRRTLIRIYAMRGTLFLFSRDMAPVAFGATRYKRHTAENVIKEWDLDPKEIDRVERAILDALKNGPLTSREVHNIVPKELKKIHTHAEGKTVFNWTNVRLALRTLEYAGKIFSGKRQGDSNIFGENVYSVSDIDLIGEKDAKRKLVSWYIAAYGPVTLDDISWWLNYTKGESDRILRSLKTESLTINGLDREHFMLRDDYERLKRFDGKPKGCVMLYYEDPYTKAYRHRQRLVDDEYDDQFYVGGSSMPCMMVDGRVVGVWKRSVIDIGARAFEKKYEPAVKKAAAKLQKFMKTLR